MSLSVPRARFLVLFAAIATYVTAIGNGFAYDDNIVVAQNPVVTEGQWGEAVLGRYWRDAREGSGLYRPVTVTSFTAEWGWWGGSPIGFHIVNVLAHAGVALLVLSLVLRFTTLPGAFAAGLLFAIHPVHVEAVANVVGRAELYAAAAVLAACLLYLGGRAWGPAGRATRLAALAVLYLVGLGAKEIAVTLPGLLLLFELYDDRASLRDRIGRATPVLASLAAVLGAYLMLRWSVLGTIAGEVPAPALRGLTLGERILTALSVWPQYLRLMVYPFDLSADYAPGVLQVARTVTPGVLAGVAVIVAWVGGAVALRRKAPLVSLGLAWFALTVLPVSNLVIPSGVLVAERTLYLPSVGVAFVAAGVASAIAERMAGATRTAVLALASAFGAALLIRTVTRIPTWWSSYTVLNTLAVEHPDSYMALQYRAAGLVRVGEIEDAARAYERAVSLAPRHYGLLCDVGGFYGRRRNYARAEEILRQAIAVTPDQPTAYRLLAEQLIRRGDGREGHRVALAGLSRAGPDRELWALVSEAYIAKGDLEASVRARRAALAQDSTSTHDWGRLAALLEALGREDEAADALARIDTFESPEATREPR